MHDKPAGEPAIQTGVSPPFQIKRPFRSWFLLLLPVVFWIWLCRDWPTRLGFFSDDWMILLHPVVGTAQAFHDVAKLTVTRPVSTPFIWLAQVIVDWSPIRSQLLNAAMLLVTAASVGMLAAAIVSSVRRLRDGALVCACVAAIGFIVFPSNVGTFAWSVSVFAIVPAVPLFCLATSILLYADRSAPRLFVGLILATLSHLSYEAFYFQEVTIIFLATTLRGGGLKDIPWRVLIGVTIVNVACIVFNRLSIGIIHKTFNPEFLQVFIGGYSRVLPILGHATREHVSLITGAGLVSVLYGSFFLAQRVGIFRVPFAYAIITCGIIASGFLYASAGYGLAAEGPMARVGIVLATYCSIIAGVLAAGAWSAVERHRLAIPVFWIPLCIALVALNLTARDRVGEWADTWSYETARLSRLPTSITSTKMYTAGDQRIFLAVEDRSPSFVEPATAPWEIGGAIAWASYKNTNSRLLTANVWSQHYRWFATPRSWFNRWDGHRFEHGLCADGKAIYDASGSELWSWNLSTGVLGKIDAPWEYGCK